MRNDHTLWLLAAALIFSVCAAPLEVLETSTIDKYVLSEADLAKLVYRIDGEVIFSREVENFESSRRAASDVLRKSTRFSDFTERVALRHNTDGFFHHITAERIFIQIMGGELILPFDLSTGKLTASSVVVDGKRYEYEEGEATLMFNLKNLKK